MPEPLHLVLAKHALHGIDCSGHAYEAHGAHCACGLWQVEPDSWVGAAELQWGKHVAAILADFNGPAGDGEGGTGDDG